MEYMLLDFSDFDLVTVELPSGPAAASRSTAASAGDFDSVTVKLPSGPMEYSLLGSGAFDSVTVRLPSGPMEYTLFGSDDAPSRRLFVIILLNNVFSPDDVVGGLTKDEPLLLLPRDEDLLEREQFADGWLYFRQGPFRQLLSAHRSTVIRLGTRFDMSSLSGSGRGGGGSCV